MMHHVTISITDIKLIALCQRFFCIEDLRNYACNITNKFYGNLKFFKIKFIATEQQ